MTKLPSLHSSDDLQFASIEEAVQSRYTEVAQRGAQGVSCCGDSCAGSDSASSAATSLYDRDELDVVTEEAAAASAGCGNPIGLSEVKLGETVLDLGSGGGIDCFLAAQAVGKNGSVIGVDMTHAMVDLARSNARKLDADNVVFKLGKIEAIPERDETVDLVISNCVIALAPDKDRVFDEIYRVLKVGGRFVISDMVVTDELPDAVRASAEEWVSCVGGADLMIRYLERIERAGFTDVNVLSDVAMRQQEDGSHWSDSVRSITVRAYKSKA